MLRCIAPTPSRRVRLCAYGHHTGASAFALLRDAAALAQVHSSDYSNYVLRVNLFNQSSLMPCWSVCVYKLALALAFVSSCMHVHVSERLCLCICMCVDVSVPVAGHVPC